MNKTVTERQNIELNIKINEMQQLVKSAERETERLRTVIHNYEIGKGSETEFEA